MYLSGLKLNQPIKGFKKLDLRGLGSVVLLAGKNGSGKSRLLKLLTQYQKVQDKNQKGEYLSDEEKEILDYVQPELMGKDGQKIEIKEYTKINFLNYSQYDVPLQSPDRFPTYVISKAKENLAKCDFEESALDALLYLKYLIKHYRYAACRETGTCIKREPVFSYIWARSRGRQRKKQCPSTAIWPAF